MMDILKGYIIVVAVQLNLVMVLKNIKERFMVVMIKGIMEIIITIGCVVNNNNNNIIVHFECVL